MVPAGKREVGRAAAAPKPEAYPRDRQEALGARTIDRLSAALERDPSGLTLRSDPEGLAPERLLVFDVLGDVGGFARAARDVGLDLVDEVELEPDEEDFRTIRYLLVPDTKALKKLVGLWRTWREQGELPRGFAPWRKVFERLRDLRPWGPQDRIEEMDAAILSEAIEDLPDSARLSVEIELVFLASEAAAIAQESRLTTALVGRGGEILDRARRPEFVYHALLVALPVGEIRTLIDRTPDGIAGLDEVMHVRPQSLVTEVDTADVEPGFPISHEGDLAQPILAVLDGVPVARHPRLAAHLVVEDRFDLEPRTTVEERVHGTAMASLVIHGDLNRQEEPLPRRVHFVPVLGERDGVPADRLVIDVVYQAVVGMLRGAESTAPEVIIVNHSLGNSRRTFQGLVSPWARLIDHLSFEFGLVIVVSAGNHGTPFEIPAFSSFREFETAPPDARATGVAAALAQSVRNRRLLSPAESVNALTIGAANADAIPPDQRYPAYAVDPYPAHRTANPSSALGPGFINSVKPEIMMPGGREHLRINSTPDPLIVEPVKSSRAGGLLVAAPPRAGMEFPTGYSGATSGAAALASRLCHRIHDALEEAYGEAFLSIPRHQRAALLKALAVHTARWPAETYELLTATLPKDSHHAHVKDQVRRFIGFGLVDSEAAVACATDRATFWATGTVGREQRVEIAMPVPQAIASQALPHTLSATLAWLTPTGPGRSAYRSARLEILDPAEIASLRVTAAKEQPDKNQTARGTVFTRIWAGDRAPVVTGPDDVVRFSVQRKPDAGTPVDAPIPFGVAITLTMPGVAQIYEQCRQALAQRVGARVPVP